MRGGRLAGAAAAGLLLSVLLSASCSWHHVGEASASASAAADDVPAPALGMRLPEVLAIAGAHEAGDFTVGAQIVRIARVENALWVDVPPARARAADFAPDPAADYAVVALHTCSDWVGRERFSEQRASWFLLSGGALVGFDQWTFAPRCALGNRFRPVPDASPARATERDLLRWLEQRYPPGEVPIELRFQRGHAYLASGRIAEAKALMSFGDQYLQAREDLFEKRAVSDEEVAAFETEGKRLRGLRADLGNAIRRAEDAQKAAVPR